MARRPNLIKVTGNLVTDPVMKTNSATGEEFLPIKIIMNPSRLVIYEGKDGEKKRRPKNSDAGQIFTTVLTGEMAENFLQCNQKKGNMVIFRGVNPHQVENTGHDGKQYFETRFKTTNFRPTFGATMSGESEHSFSALVNTITDRPETLDNRGELNPTTYVGISESIYMGFDQKTKEYKYDYNHYMLCLTDAAREAFFKADYQPKDQIGLHFENPRHSFSPSREDPDVLVKSLFVDSRNFIEPIQDERPLQREAQRLAAESKAAQAEAAKAASKETPNPTPQRGKSNQRPAPASPGMR